jgi:subtilisin family serine protease
MKKLYRCLGLLFLFLVYGLVVNAQKPNWQNLDLQTDNTFGISTERAYKELLNGKLPNVVLVAIIDAGIDTNHEDLKAVLWQNPRVGKFSGSHGWSFIGSAKGNVHFDNLEVTRQVRQYMAKDTTKLSGSDLATFHAEKKDLLKQKSDADRTVQGISNFKNILDGITHKIGKDNPSQAAFKAYQPQGEGETYVTKVVIEVLSKNDDFATFKKGQVDDALEHFKDNADYHLNTDFDPRSIVGDNYFNSKQRNYGSPDVNGPDPTHGTHVSGIIAAVRNNGIGINGIADDVRIMSIRAVPDGDERDKDVANAIRYATDHGAKVINMSFGKPYSQDKKTVDEAVKYALKKDVLLVQAAGNSNENIDTTANFPNRIYANGKQAGAWIVVGASGWKNDSTLKAPFSNYGKTAVDVFAPGEQIYSCIPGSKYASFDGTSMACPVVAGLAALIREYYPKLTALQVKAIILQSVVKVDHNVNNLVNGKTVSVPFSDLCATGGIVNAYKALKLAGQQATNTNL